MREAIGGLPHERKEEKEGREKLYTEICWFKSQNVLKYGRIFISSTFREGKELSFGHFLVSQSGKHISVSNTMSGAPIYSPNYEFTLAMLACHFSFVVLPFDHFSLSHAR